MVWTYCSIPYWACPSLIGMRRLSLILNRGHPMTTPTRWHRRSRTGVGSVKTERKRRYILYMNVKHFSNSATNASRPISMIPTRLQAKRILNGAYIGLQSSYRQNRVYVQWVITHNPTMAPSRRVTSLLWMMTPIVLKPIRRVKPSD